MGKKMKFPFLFKTIEEDSTTTTTATVTSWQWPSCGAHKTLSFRAPGGDVFKTMNSAYEYTATEPEDPGGDDPVEAVISGLRAAERLFFEPGETSSILGRRESKGAGQRAQQIRPEKEESGGGVLVAMDSVDPHADFKRSMEEMVEADDGLREWDRLEELLGWYLKANGKENHGYIVEAFVDLLAGLAISATCCCCSSSSTASSDSDDRNRDRSFSVMMTSTACSLNSPLSFSSSITSSSTSSTITPCLSSLEADQDEFLDKNSG